MTGVCSINFEKINEAQRRLENHPLLVKDNFRDIHTVKKFMECHVFAVWDFMSLLKFLQDEIAPSGGYWVPNRKVSPRIVRLINDIVVCEESDVTPVDGEYMSHFDLYLTAMREIGADPAKVIEMVDFPGDRLQSVHIEGIPHPSRAFVNNTFEFLQTDKPHVVAAAFTFGRETIIPKMFQGILKQLDVNAVDAPYFHFYLERHIQVDGDDHGPASLKLLETLIGNDPEKAREAEETALLAIQHRYQFWTGVMDYIAA